MSTALTSDESRAGRHIVLPGQTPDGEHIMAVLVKRTYDIGGRRCVRAEADRKLIPGDVHYGDPMNSTVRFETDFIPFKVATDVVLNGTAYAPDGKRTAAMEASLRIGQVQKTIRVIGDRVCRHRDNRPPLFTDPVTFSSMELRYERSYGGVDIYSNPVVPCAYPRNHLGRGFVVKNVKKAVENLPLPNLEDPAAPLTPERIITGEVKDWVRQPMPQGFGWFGKSWLPRAGFAGIMPAERELHQELRKIYAEVIPEAQRALYEQTALPDIDFRFFSGASEGLTCSFLSGHEMVRLVNLSPEREVEFELPNEYPRIALDIGMGPEEPPVMLHTVMIRMDERQLDLVWRAAASYPGPDWLPEMTRMEVLVQ
jgi:hypothetical protein